MQTKVQQLPEVQRAQLDVAFVGDLPEIVLARLRSIAKGERGIARLMARMYSVARHVGQSTGLIVQLEALVRRSVE